MAMSLGLIVHLAMVVISTCDNFFEDIPILSTRLVADNGESITGGLATDGSLSDS
jgi:hypothetical protein